MYNTKQAAQYLGISPYYLRNMRQGLHPHDAPTHTLGPHPRGNKDKFAYFYAEADLKAWMLSHTRRKKTK